MALKEAQPEPSMEEILASIRRIISEEEEAPKAETLELSQPAPPPADDDLMVFDADDAPPPQAAPVVHAPPVQHAAPPPTRAAAPAPVASHYAAPVEGETIISQPTASAAAGALTRLAGSLRIADQQGQTIEGVVRELLKPMLKDWLEQNLPAIVESRVEAELERIARLAR